MNASTYPPRHFRRATITASLYVWSLLLIAPATVIAGPLPTNTPETASAKVSLTDLDITTEAGLAAAQKRLAAAAKNLCQTFSDDRKVADRQTSADCYRDTLANALRHLDSRVAAARSGRSDVAQNVR
jgi:UrcA family protein